ncbi:hypothetical protein LTR37_014144 [Vermiconidia calcicola]|uniref:Uncharacterized protein n=1 Tax=Vermiconidia calcicola TaxID=1690605 RepID=A0ACC3MUG3_9PEZI|nr:hypothetical protein LTR37_014144 [Vermiconidia calcicola]
MTYQFHPGKASVLKDKVVVLTGGALGVGASVVRILHSTGAHVFFGDVLDEPGTALEQELSTNPKTTIKYIHCDVTSYEQNLGLFDAALQAFGRIDHAIANAGIGEQGSMFDPNLTLETVREEPDREMKVVDVNLKGELYFARIASVYMQQGADNQQSRGDKSLTLVSSVAGFREDPGLNVYVPAKHGVLGLMRVLREYVQALCGHLEDHPDIEPRLLINSSPCPIRTNAISPWMTKTRLTQQIEGPFEEAGLPSNTAEDVANVIVGVLSESSLNGGTLYIEGGRAWNIEAGLMKLKPQWIGVKQNSDLDKGTQLMGSGDHWIRKDA